MAWEALHAVKLRDLQRALAKPSSSPGQRAQYEQRIAVILDQRPSRDYAVSRCLEAWADLSTERAVGFSVGAIPWSSIVNWCEFHELDREATQVMVHVIRRIDNDRAIAQADADDKRKATGGKGRR